ncbi:MAG: aminotransferase class III-fold pyridoxal phosphate-dependent enzyme [Deltaproteobacteria bacterium]|nr:aminotransferase class III-fold pyridoxal phosphate-dependent enzyme [Deltaproteobacteria bacterium]
MSQQVAEELSTEELLAQAEQSLIYIVTRPQEVMVRGKGSYIWDSRGREYLDFIQGWAVNCLGHSPRVLVNALNRQAREMINASPYLFNRPMIELAGLLTANSCLDRVFFANSGAEANEGALKLARKYGQKHLGGAYEVITTYNGFHGRTLAMMSASGKTAWDGLFEPKVPGFRRVHFNKLNEVRKSITPKTCAIMVEPVQGEAGVFVASKSFMKGLRQLCDDHGILLILDEIQTGLGRTGSMFAYEQYGIEPDIMTLGKALGGGFPVSALLAKDHVCVFDAGDQGGTFCAQPLAMTAGLTVVRELLHRNIPRRAASRGRVLKRHLKALGEKHGFREIRGRGLLMAVELHAEKGPEIVAEAFRQGLIINSPRPTTLRFMPSLLVSNAEIGRMAEILDGVLTQVLR